MELNAAGVRVPRQESQTPSLLDKARPLAEWARPEDCERGEGAEGVVVLDGHDDPDAHPPVIEDMLALLVLGQQAREAGGYGAALLAVDFHQGFSPRSVTLKLLAPARTPIYRRDRVACRRWSQMPSGWTPAAPDLQDPEGRHEECITG